MDYEKGETHSFRIEDAKKHGVEKAILLYNIRYWLRHNKANSTHIHDGKVWTYNSAKAFELLFPYFAKSTIARWLTELYKDGIISKGNYNKSGFDKTTWFTLNEPEFTGVLILSTPISQSETSITQSETSMAQSETTIPDIITNIITDNSPLNSPAKPTKKTFLPIGPGFCVESKTSPRKLFLRHDSAVDTYNRYKKNLLENQSGLTLYDLTYTENITLNITNAAGVEIPVVLPIADNIKTNEDMKLAIEASNFLYEAGFYCFDTYRPYLLSYRNTGDIKRLWDIYLK